MQSGKLTCAEPVICHNLSKDVGVPPICDSTVCSPRYNAHRCDQPQDRARRSESQRDKVERKDDALDGDASFRIDTRAGNGDIACCGDALTPCSSLACSIDLCDCDSWSQEFLLVRWYGSNAPDRRQKGWMGLDRRTLPSSGAKWRALLRRSHRLVFFTPYGSGPIIDLLQAGLRSITSCVSCPGPLFGQEVRLPGAKRPRWLPSTLRSNDILEP
mmetsp:Transcript_26569/g.65733  ORF Transcript_26569/g.65733 Transcript_26569/m.65733 type:complete len:215 (-) Transcript_26569:269-913(-)